MSMSVVPRPFHNCRNFPVNNLVTIDGTPLPLAEIARRRSVVLAALDLDMSTPSAGQILSQLLLPVYGRPRQGSSRLSVDSGGDMSIAVTKDLHELLLCCDTYIIILAKEPLHQCRQLQSELAVAGESLSRPGVPPLAVGSADEGSSSPRKTNTLDGTHLLPGCLAIVHDEGAELLQMLQLVGLDGRTVPAIFKIASERLHLQDGQVDHTFATGELALQYRQFGLAHAGVQHSLEQQLLVERASTERLAQSLLTTVDRLVVKFEPLQPPRLEPEPAADSAEVAELAVSPAQAAASPGFADKMPPPIVEHIFSQLLHVCERPGAVVCAMCVCRSWYAAGSVIFNAAITSAAQSLRCALPIVRDGSGVDGFACCEEGLGDGPVSMDEAEIRVDNAYPPGTCFPLVPTAIIAERANCVLGLLRWARHRSHMYHVCPRQLKDEGNRHFVSANTQTQQPLALWFYSAALVMCRPLPPQHNDAAVMRSTRMALHGNLAAVLLRLGDPDNTVRECTRALELADAHPDTYREQVALAAKIRVRRAKAQLELGKLPLAVRDLQFVLVEDGVPQSIVDLARAELDHAAGFDGDRTF